MMLTRVMDCLIPGLHDIAKNHFCFSVIVVY